MAELNRYNDGMDLFSKLPRSYIFSRLRNGKYCCTELIKATTAIMNQ